MGKPKRPKYIITQPENFERAKRVLDATFGDGESDDRLDDMTDARVLPQLGDPYPQPVETLAEVEGETVAVTDGQVLPVPKPRRYSPPSCSACTALRPAGKDYTEVYCTKREGEYVFRYCRCDFCGNTFKDSERV